jgi:hypothetical protein
MFDDSFERKLNGIRYHFGSDNNPFFGNEFNSIFRDLKSEANPSFNLFKQKLDAELERIKINVKVRKFDLYYPVNIQTGKKIDILKFKDASIQILDYSDVKEKLESDELSEALKFEKFTKSRYKYVNVTTWARNKEYAQVRSTKYVEVILGFIALSQNFGSTSLTLFGTPEPLTQVKLRYVFVFSSGSFNGYYYFQDRTDANKFYELTDRDVKNLNELLDQFNNVNGQMQEIIYKGLSSYYAGLLDNNLSYSYLNLWTALEVISLKSKNLSHAELIKRVKATRLELTSLESHQIDRLYSLRNNLVHSGYSKITQYDRNLLKAYVESMIIFFMFDLTKYNIDEINQIFQFLQKDDKTLVESKKLIDFVVGLRNQKNKKAP